MTSSPPTAGEDQPMSRFDVDAMTALARQEILADVADGTVVVDEVTTFADLHDFVDANTYGGLCAFGDISDDEHDDWIAAGNAMQDRLAAWIADGGLR